MEEILLSKMEELAEWFMRLFFDPMYFDLESAVADTPGVDSGMALGVVAAGAIWLVGRVNTEGLEKVLKKRVRRPGKQGLKAVDQGIRQWAETVMLSFGKLTPGLLPAIGQSTPGKSGMLWYGL